MNVVTFMYVCWTESLSLVLLFFYCCSSPVVSIFLPPRPPPQPSPPRTLKPTVFGFVHVSFIHVPWWLLPYFPPLSLYLLPSGYCQFVLYFNVSGYILLACLFEWFLFLKTLNERCRKPSLALNHVWLLRAAPYGSWWMCMQGWLPEGVGGVCVAHGCPQGPSKGLRT